jgi:hypothetical protein
VTCLKSSAQKLGVIPAESARAGIQEIRDDLDSRLRAKDDRWSTDLLIERSTPESLNFKKMKEYFGSEGVE